MRESIGHLRKGMTKSSDFNGLPRFSTFAENNWESAFIFLFAIKSRKKENKEEKLGINLPAKRNKVVKASFYYRLLCLTFLEIRKTCAPACLFCHTGTKKAHYIACHCFANQSHVPLLTHTELSSRGKKKNDRRR